MNDGRRAGPSDQSNSLSSALEVLRRRWMIVLGAVILCTALSAIQQKRAKRTYKATASVAFQNATLSDTALQVSSSGSGDPQRDADTQVTIASSPEVAQGVRKQLGASASAEELLSSVSVEAAANADVLNITASTSAPAYSATLANAFANQYIAFRANSQLASLGAAKAQLQQQLAVLPAGSPEAASLQQSIRRLSELRAVVGSGATVIGRARAPSKASGMRLSTAVLIGFLVGLALAFSIVFVLESVDHRVKSLEELEREYRLSVLAVVPQSSRRPVRAADRMDLLEPYRILRSALEFVAVTRPLKTLLVTSAVPSEGKTSVSVDLAQAVALTGRRVVLVELDLRMPTFARHFDLDDTRGVTTALLGSAAPSKLLVKPFPELPNLSVLPSGRLPHNPSELLASSIVADMITELGEEENTMVIIDAPPLIPVADTQVLLNCPAVGATLIVARLGKTTRDETRRARTILDRHMSEPVGLVVTGVRESRSYSYERYGESTSQIEGSVNGSSSRPASAARKPLVR